MLKIFISFVLVFSAAIFAEDIKENTNSIHIHFAKENQIVDTSNWITFPINSEYKDNDAFKVEKIKVSFPSEPKLMEENDNQPSCFTVTDQEGMTYNIASMQIPEENFSLRKSVEFIAESLSKPSSAKRLIDWGCLDQETESKYFIVWLQNDKMTRLNFIKSAHFIYVLETSKFNESIESQDISAHDRLKAELFVNSLVIQ